MLLLLFSLTQSSSFSYSSSLSPNGGGGRTIDGNHSSLPLPLVSLSRNGGEIEVGTRDVGRKPVWEFRDFRCDATTVDNRQFSYYWLYMATRRERKKPSPEFEFIYFLFPFFPVRETLRDCPCFGGRGRKEKKGRTSGGVGGTFSPPFFPYFPRPPFLSLSLWCPRKEGKERESGGGGRGFSGGGLGRHLVPESDIFWVAMFGRNQEK